MTWLPKFYWELDVSCLGRRLGRVLAEAIHSTAFMLGEPGSWVGRVNDILAYEDNEDDDTDADGSVQQKFTPVLVVNGNYNAIMCSTVEGFTNGMLVRAIPVYMPDGSLKWQVDQPPFYESAVVEGENLIPIHRAEPAL